MHCVKTAKIALAFALASPVAVAAPKDELQCRIKKITLAVDAKLLTPDQGKVLAWATADCLKFPTSNEQNQKLVLQIANDARSGTNPFVAALKVFFSATSTAPRELDEMGKYKELRDKYLPNQCFGAASSQPCT